MIHRVERCREIYEDEQDLVITQGCRSASGAWRSQCYDSRGMQTGRVLVDYSP